MKTQAYFGHGVYAEFNGYHIVLTANGVGEEATDRIYLEPHMAEQMAAWVANGHRDYNSGLTFTETAEPALPLPKVQA
jgi:hypothetical protein